jgi:cellulose synthase/poly-beta-1,6-N-acetylglucosamine synthase-like glycosyltransferase
MVEVAFWLCAGLTVYAYAGYPFVLAVLVRLAGRPVPLADLGEAELPGVTLIVPVHNERSTIERKVENTEALDYPPGRLEVLYVSDGSSDGTNELLEARVDARSTLMALETRGGKGAALNAALGRAQHEIIVFNDASIMLQPHAIRKIVRGFATPSVGCVSGEDRIADLGGEGLYGRYELGLRRLESRLHSIVGASGSFYAQRRSLCEPFVPNLAPDFLSVLRTVERGFRAIADPEAVGTMSALRSTRDEFERKVRTLLRGITTLVVFGHLLNPFRYGWFAFELLSHKLARWLVPFFLIGMLATSGILAVDSLIYRLLFLGQAVFYALAAFSLVRAPGITALLPVKISVYFTTVNLATLSAWLKYLTGTRQELWSPSRR